MGHRDDYVWIWSTFGVVGVTYEWLNSKIAQYNKSKFLRSTGSFWEWLSWEEGQDMHGICSYLTKEPGKILKIRGIN